MFKSNSGITGFGRFGSWSKGSVSIFAADGDPSMAGPSFLGYYNPQFKVVCILVVIETQKQQWLSWK